jgi:hypothetical protein
MRSSSPTISTAIPCRVLQPLRQILAPIGCGQCFVVGAPIHVVVLLESKETTGIKAALVEDQRGQGAGGASIAIDEGVDTNALIMDNARDSIPALKATVSTMLEES